LICLRPQADLAPLHALSAESWQDLNRQARWYGLLPLVNRRLVQAGPELTIPSDITGLLREAYLHTLVENMRQYHTLAQALTALQAADIPVLLLKGAHLAEQIYGDIGLRPMADFDLLVPRPGLAAALDALQRAGFEAEREYIEEADGALHYHAPALTKNGTALEVHWNLAQPDSPVNPDLAGLWRRAVPVPLSDGPPALGLAPLDLLLYLCVHASYGHAFSNQLRSLVDIAEVLKVQGRDLNWPTFTEAADAWNARKGVYLALRLAVDLLGADVPPAALAALQPPGFDPRALEWAQMQLFRRTPTLSSNFNRLVRRGTPGERLQALGAALFPPPAVMGMVYGVAPRSWRMAGLYPYNAVTRVTGYWRHALTLLKHDPQRVQEADSSLNLLDWLGIKG